MCHVPLAALLSPLLAAAPLADVPLGYFYGDKAGDRLRGAASLFVDAGAGRVYVADSENGRIVAFELATGKLLAKLTAGSKLKLPVAAGRGADKALWVIDQQAVPAQGALLRVDLGAKSVETVHLAATAAEPLSRPSRLAVDRRGNLVVLDPGARRILIANGKGELLRTLRLPAAVADAVDLQLTPAGTYLLACPTSSQVAELTPDGKVGRRWAAPDALVFPVSAAQDSRGLVYVADSHAHRLVVLGADGKVLQTIGRRGARAGELSYPSYVALAPNGEVLVLDSGNERVALYGPAALGAGKP